MVKYFLILCLVAIAIVGHSQKPNMDNSPNQEKLKELDVKGFDEYWELYNQGKLHSSNLMVKKRFDQDGKITLRWNYSFDIVESINSHVFEYNEDGLKTLQTRHIIYNPKGKEIDPILETDDLLTEKQWSMYYDEENRLNYSISLPEFKSDSPDTTFYSYNEQGLLNSKSSDQRKWEFVYNDKEQLMQETEHSFRKRTSKFHYNEEGKIDSIFTTYISILGNDTITSKYRYNSQKLIESYIEHRNGELYQKEEYEYDESGLLVLTRRFDVNTGLIESIDKREYLYFKE